MSSRKLLINDAMKIIDAHIHLKPSEETPVAGLLHQMDTYGVEKAMLILNVQEEYEAFNRDIVSYKTNKERFWVAAGLNIHDMVSQKQVDWLVNEGIASSIKIHPHLFSLTKKDIPAVIDILSHYDTSVIVDSLYYGQEIEYHNGVEYGVAIGRAFPNRNVVIAHAGSLDFLKCMMATRYMKNVFYDYSFIQSFFNRTSIRFDMVDFLRRTSNKIIWGSDYPSFDIKKALEDFLSIAEEAGISDAQRQDVLYNNAVRIYG